MSNDRNYMFLSVGQRDLQIIYDTGSVLLRDFDSQIDFKDASSYSVENSVCIKEKKICKQKDVRKKSICFPMLDKSLESVIKEGIDNIDCLFLLCTNRNKYVNKLNELYEVLSKDESKLDLADYIEKLLSYAKKDKTSQTAELLKSKIEQNGFRHHNVAITKVEIIDTGNYGFLEPIKELSGTESRAVLEKTLFRIDINILDFFEYELVKALKPFFKELNGNRIFLSTYSGGMPIMQRALDIVLDSSLIYYQASPIFHSENLTFQSPSEPIDNYLKQLKSMTYFVLSLDWESAKYQFNNIKGNKDFHRYYNKQIIPTMEPVFNEATKLNTDKDAKWFDRFATLMLRALYQRNINDVLVWLKCLEEATLNECLYKEKKLWQVVRFDPNTRLKSVYRKPGSEPIPAFPDILHKHFDKNDLSNTFKGYVPIFLNSKDFTWNDDWDVINSYRNDLIHKGKSAVKIEKRILKFIQIDPADMQKAIQHLSNKDLDALIQFESKCWNNGFFQPLRQIAEKPDKDYVLPLRRLSKTYAELVLNL